MKDEEALITFIGLHNYKTTSKHDNNFAYAITNKRIIMAQKGTLSGHKLQTVYLDNINDINFQSGMILGVMTIDTTKETFNVGLDKKSAEKVNSKVHEVIDELKSIKNQPQQPTISNVSVADDIKKFKELLDMEAITQDEFDAKKKQLLGL